MNKLSQLLAEPIASMCADLAA